MFLPIRQGSVDVPDQLAKVSAPMLVIHTRGDLVNRFEDGRDLATEGEAVAACRIVSVLRLGW